MRQFEAFRKERCLVQIDANYFKFGILGKNVSEGGFEFRFETTTSSAPICMKKVKTVDFGTSLKAGQIGICPINNSATKGDAKEEPEQE